MAGEDGPSAADPRGPAGRRRDRPAVRRASRPGGRGQDRFAGLFRTAAGFVVLLAAAAAVAAVVGTGATELPQVSGLVEAGPAVRFGIPVARTLLDVCAVAAAGVAILARLLGFDQPEQTEPVMRSARRAGLWASVGWTVAALAVHRAAHRRTEPGTVPGPDRDLGLRLEHRGRQGSAAVGGVRAGLGAAARLSLRHGENVPAELRAGIALFGLLPLPLTGHASNWAYHDLSMVADGTARGDRERLGRCAGRGDRVPVAAGRNCWPWRCRGIPELATWCVLIVGTTGVFTGLLELALSPVTSLPESLWTHQVRRPGAGQGGAHGGDRGIAIVVRTRLLPLIAAGRRTAVAVWCGWELIVLALAFGVAVVLTRASVTPF